MKYTIKHIKHSGITGKEQEFVHLQTSPSLTDRQVNAEIQDSCSLTNADLQAAYAAIGDCLQRELLRGSTFHIPGVGYFSLSAKLNLPEGMTIDKVRGEYISVRKIKFRPETKLLNSVRLGAKFERAAATPTSPQYTDEELLERITDYITANGYVTRRNLETEFALKKPEALKRLKVFSEKGVLRKAGARNSPVYLLPTET